MLAGAYGRKVRLREPMAHTTFGPESGHVCQPGQASALVAAQGGGQAFRHPDGGAVLGVAQPGDRLAEVTGRLHHDVLALPFHLAVQHRLQCVQRPQQVHGLLVVEPQRDGGGLGEQTSQRLPGAGRTAQREQRLGLGMRPEQALRAVSVAPQLGGVQGQGRVSGGAQLQHRREVAAPPRRGLHPQLRAHLRGPLGGHLGQPRVPRGRPLGVPLAREPSAQPVHVRCQRQYPFATCSYRPVPLPGHPGARTVPPGVFRAVAGRRADHISGVLSRRCRCLGSSGTPLGGRVGGACVLA